MYCKQCGKEVTPGARFCGGCGAPLGKAAPPPAAASGISRNVWIALGSTAGIVLLGMGVHWGLGKWYEMRATRYSLSLAIAKGCAKAGRLDQAMQVAQAMQDPGSKSAALPVIARRLRESRTTRPSAPSHCQHHRRCLSEVRCIGWHCRQIRRSRAVRPSPTDCQNN